MPSSVKQMYAITAGVSLLALLGFVFAPHIFAAWVDAPNNPPTYGATGCSPFPCSEDDFKPVTQTTVNQSKQGRLAIGTSNPPGYTVDVAGDVNITGSYRINGVSLTQGGGSVLSGAGTANYLSKWTNGTALQDSLVFDNGTNVGIGTQTFTALPFPLTPADNKLEVGGVIVGKGFFDQDDPTYYLDPASSGSGNLLGNLTMGGILTAGNVVVGGSSVCRADGTNCPSAANYWTLSGTDIYSNNTENVGIGTATPTAKLDVNGTAKVITLQFADGTTQTTAPASSASHGIAKFTNNNTWQAPAGVTTVWVSMSGGGGGGGGSASSGACVNGTIGGNSSFGSLLVATGGAGGTATGGAGGTATGGDGGTSGASGAGVQTNNMGGHGGGGSFGSGGAGGAAGGGSGFNGGGYGGGGGGATGGGCKGGGGGGGSFVATQLTVVPLTNYVINVGNGGPGGNGYYSGGNGTPGFMLIEW